MYDLLDIRYKISGVRTDIWVKLIYVTRHLGLRRDLAADFNGFVKIFLFVGYENPVSHVPRGNLPTHLPSVGRALVDTGE